MAAALIGIAVAAGQAPSDAGAGRTSSEGRGQEALVPGLVATYTDGDHTVRLVVPTPNFYLEAEESLHPSLGASFEAEWSGLLSVLRAGRYRFDAGEAELWVDERQAGRTPVELQPGRHAIRVRFQRRPGPARLRLQWEAQHFALEPVPSSRFFHPASAAPGPEDALAERGRLLAEQLACMNCHQTGSPSLAKPMGPVLTDIGSRVQPGWMEHWLKDAQAFRPGALMPNMLSEQQALDVASYLASLKPPASGERVRRSSLDSYDGRDLYGSIGCAACHQQPELSLDGLEAKTTITSVAEFLLDPSKIYPDGRMPSLMLSEKEARQLAVFLVRAKDADRTPPAYSGGGDAARGKAVVQSAGCLACHELSDPRPLPNELRAPRLEDLDPRQGCLAADPQNAPRFALNDEQRSALRAFVSAYRSHPDRSRAPVYEFRGALERLRCVACHEADRVGPTAALAESAPPLTGAGEKLRTDWIEGVLTGRKRIASWLVLRMPHYQPDQAAPLIEGFAKAAGLEPGPGPEAPPFTEEQVQRGWGMLGTNPEKGGMACVSCHDWGEKKALGEHGPDLRSAGERLRYDWYQRWMLNPARILSGTSMPNYFSSMARDEAGQIIHTFWAALRRGPDLPVPEGFAEPALTMEEEVRPKPKDEAVIVRWEMPEATPGAFAVGMPGGVSYCFDSVECRLRYAWSGGFIDLTRSLQQKVEEDTRYTVTAELLGEIFYRAAEFPFRSREADRVPEREFRGYRLIRSYPEFHYQIDGVDVRELVMPAEGNDGFVHQFEVSAADEPIWYVPQPGEQVEITPTLQAGADGKILLPRGSNVRFEVRVVKKR